MTEDNCAKAAEHQDNSMGRQSTETRKDVEKHNAQHAVRQCRSKVSKVRRQMCTEHTPHNMPGDSIPQDFSTECPSEQGTTYVQRKSSNRGNCHTANSRGHMDNIFIARQNLETFRENTVEVYNVGMTSQSCSSCGASIFTGENSKGRTGKTPNATFLLSCRYGDIKLPPISDPPCLLQELLTSDAQKDWHFRDNIWAYDSGLAFALMSISGTEYKFPHRGPYCFRISGQII